MIKIKTLNQISTIIYNYLPQDKYLISPDVENPDAILVRSASCHDLTFNDNLLAIARAGVGVNNIPIPECTRRGIAVFNTPGANANAVKELVLTAMFFVSRNIIPAMEWVQTLKGKGDEVSELVERGKRQFVGPELKGKKLGVVGLGSIGVMVANDATTLGMEVMGYDPFISVESAWGLSSSVTRALNLEALVSQCDYISIHVPLIEKTRDLFNAEIFKRIKQGSFLLNFSRDNIVNTRDVIEALDGGRLAYYITDFPVDELLGHPKIIAIPHLGASTPESEENCASMAAQQLRLFFESGDIRNSVNLPNCELMTTSEFRLCVLHKNIPQMVSKFASILGESNINIGDMINKSAGELAYSLFALDDPLCIDGVNRIKNIDGVLRVRSM
ncbi:MAG: 3-phosphoglycerate dehydrogenase family protein [Bacillota bacterium]